MHPRAYIGSDFQLWMQLQERSDEGFALKNWGDEVPCMAALSSTLALFNDKSVCGRYSSPQCDSCVISFKSTAGRFF